MSDTFFSCIIIFVYEAIRPNIAKCHDNKAATKSAVWNNVNRLPLKSTLECACN